MEIIDNALIEAIELRSPLGLKPGVCVDGAEKAFPHVWVGAKKRDSKSNKETGMKEVENAVK